MLKFACFPLAIGLAILAPSMAKAESSSAVCIDCGGAAAANPAATMALPNLPEPSANVSDHPVEPKVYRREKVIGRVRQVQGSTLFLALDNGQIERVNIPNATNADFTQLLGKRIVLTNVDCTPPQSVAPPPSVPMIVPQRW